MDSTIGAEQTGDSPVDGAQRSVTVLGSTGSIGTNTLDVIRQHADKFEVKALTAHQNVSLLAQQARELRADVAVIGDETLYEDLKKALSGSAVKAAAGPQAIEEAGAMGCDVVMAGIVGAAGLPPVLAAVRRGGIVAFANKECLVSAGDLMVREVAKHGATLLPVDSEHNAIFQVFDFEAADQVRRVLLTASGGPFRQTALADLANVTPAQAVAHPNWDMGAKISVDSATMMNKGLELIEAFHLFPVKEDQIEIIVHPQSVVHSAVEYVDGSVLAQMGSPDMRTPIAYSLAWPNRIETNAPSLDLTALATLTFEAPDTERFRSLILARQALRDGGCQPTYMNAANEVAVAAFLEERCGFLQIAQTVEAVMNSLETAALTSLDDVFEADNLARRRANEILAAG